MSAAREMVENIQTLMARSDNDRLLLSAWFAALLLVAYRAERLLVALEKGDDRAAIMSELRDAILKADSLLANGWR